MFFIAFLDDLGNFKHFEPYWFFRTFDFYTLQSAIVKQHYHGSHLNLKIIIPSSKAFFNPTIAKVSGTLLTFFFLKIESKNVFIVSVKLVQQGQTSDSLVFDIKNHVACQSLSRVTITAKKHPRPADISVHTRL